jgi:DNA-binding response OmpR family regulator
MMAKPLIVVVNDDTTFLGLMEDLLSEEGYNTLIIKSSDTAYETIKKKEPALVVLDIRMQSAEAGFMVLDLLRLDPTTAQIPVIICSAATQFVRENEAHFRAMGCDILPKPFLLNELLTKVQAFLGPPPGV